MQESNNNNNNMIAIDSLFEAGKKTSREEKKTRLVVSERSGIGRYGFSPSKQTINVTAAAHLNIWTS